MTYLSPSNFSRIDSTHINKFKKGSMSIDDSIDLHGLRVHEAQVEFLDFIEESYESGCRYLLVVTGKGSISEGGGAIRNALPNWINASPIYDKILAYAPAHIKHGGNGAYYILLKRNNQINSN